MKLSLIGIVHGMSLLMEYENADMESGMFTSALKGSIYSKDGNLLTLYYANSCNYAFILIITKPTCVLMQNR